MTERREAVVIPTRRQCFFTRIFLTNLSPLEGPRPSPNSDRPGEAPHQYFSSIPAALLAASAIQADGIVFAHLLVEGQVLLSPEY